MDMKKWILENVKDFNVYVKTEEDLKIKVILPFLKALGYSEEDYRFENKIEVVIGSKKTFVFSDIEVIVDGNVELVIDVKKPTNSIAEKDILQSTSYAKLISTPAALYATTINGIDCVTTNTITGRRISGIPTKAELLKDINHSKKKEYTEIEIREIKSVLLTLLEPKELYKVINTCKDIIEKKGLIRSDQSFKEMTKILLVKMNEERRVKTSEGQNRFNIEYIAASSYTNKISEIEVFENLFSDAKNKYPDIYDTQDERLLIKDIDCLIEVIRQLEAFSFLGTGDDIKGAVYEIFLKSTLRGDFDQYFTPREIVDFIVNFADPELGDTFLDPACGSGGFLIQAFNYVNQKIIDSPDAELERKKKFSVLVEKSIWGNEADYDLHVLAKINMIMHGDGWNNIYQGDTLSSEKLPNEHFDLIMTNPPFTIKYNFPKVLSKYELGIGKDKEELDILFVEKSLQLLKPGGDLYIVLPEGLLNLNKYEYFRKWLLEKAHVLCSISLPEGAFIPFGGSVSKTCIIGLRKKGNPEKEIMKPNYIFLGRAIEVGYENGKKSHKKTDKNDLEFFIKKSKSIFENIQVSENLGECGWIKQDKITPYRIDASFLLNLIDREKLNERFSNLVPLKEICDVENISETIRAGELYNYLEVPDISPETGTISNIRILEGSKITAGSLYKFYPGDILFTRINPRKSRVAIVPPINGFGVVSKEVYRIVIKANNDFINESDKYVLLSLLQSEYVRNQIVRLAAGSSSSRARVHSQDLLDAVYVPLPSKKKQKEISEGNIESVNRYWAVSQGILQKFVNIQKELGTNIDKNDIRSI
ncbi:N-6 DNA methylase [Listeria monocytogenes]|nr:N-6 DNA methylase [Listeria monocytogenes]EAD7009384.1 N-6 DNA methylase [Listeria monocytogenes]EAD9914505.1 N-6 DNA methylase [Listeria monocytogenes]EAD9917244.1 N-6 DNA methylase [Listeria monocytogenes]EAG7654317.1 N-6 DNA methylase [Listeria monocytogenes]